MDEAMNPRDRLQRLLFEHRTAHDPASSEREILRMFELRDRQTVRVCLVRDAECGDQPLNWCVECPKRAGSTAHTKEQA